MVIQLATNAFQRAVFYILDQDWQGQVYQNSALIGITLLSKIGRLDIAEELVKNIPNQTQFTGSYYLPLIEGYKLFNAGDWANSVPKILNFANYVSNMFIEKDFPLINPLEMVRAYERAFYIQIACAAKDCQLFIPTNALFYIFGEEDTTILNEVVDPYDS